MRRLLRRPMDGDFALSMEREPDARLAAGVEGSRHRTILLRRGDEVVGMASRAVKEVWASGRPALLGYLGQLRVEPGRRIGRRALAAGFARLERVRRRDELPFDLTSIVRDNHAARDLLERGLPDLPTYAPLDELVTFVLPRGRHQRLPATVTRGSPALVPAIVDCLERNHSRCELATRVSAGDLFDPVRHRGLHPEDFLVIENGGRVEACLAVWDQRAFKQVVVRGYSPSIARSRPILNAGLALMRRPTLPAAGSQLALGYLAFVAADDDRAELVLELIRAARGAPPRPDLEHLAGGFAASHPLLAPVLRALRCRTYASRLYAVWPRDVRPATAPDGRPFHVEVATL